MTRRASRRPLTLPIIVGDPEFRDTPPEFTTPNVQVEVGETTTVDLRQSTAHPNPQILQQVTYSEIQPSNSALTASVNGSELSLSVPRNTPKGTTYTVAVTLRWDKFSVPATVNVTVVGSTRPPPVAVTDDYETKRPVTSYVVNPLTNDSNPYQSTGEPLRIVGATTNIGSVTFTDDEIRIVPPANPPYVAIVVAYTIEDATEDADRRVNGTINFTVTDVPDVVQKPDRDGGSQYGGDGTATIRFAAPGSNGKDITGYEVRNVQTNAVNTGCTAGAACTITGLTNGTAYTFQVRAINENGPGAWSVASDQITPYGTPGNVAPTATAVDQWAPGGSMQATWPAVAGTGGTTTYFWTASNGASGNTTGTSTGNIINLAGGNYTVEVYAQNPAGYRSPQTIRSNSVTITTQGVPPAPTITGTSPGNGTNAPATVTWSWNAVTASPGGSANLRYEVSYNSGGWVDVGTATSYSLANRPVGSHTLQVRAVNKSGPSAASAGATVTLAQPAFVRLCRYVGGGGDPLGNGYNADSYGVIWSGQSGGSHRAELDFSGFHQDVSGSAGGPQGIPGWAYSRTAIDQNSALTLYWDGSPAVTTTRGQVPSC